MNIVERAFKEIYPDKEFIYNSSVKYSGKFKPFNANVKRMGRIFSYVLRKESFWQPAVLSGMTI